MELIPGLPDDIARECLIRVDYKDVAAVASTCRNWRAEIHLPEFYRRRKAVGFSQNLVVMAQARAQPGTDFGTRKKDLVAPTYRLSILEPETGDWWELNPAFGLSDQLPLFCQLVQVGSDLIVLGGWDPMTWTASNGLFIYNFVSATWRRGADMPGVPRSFFACAASDSDRMVFVAGGHDDQKNALRSAMAYDVARDEWLPMPDMGRERDECKGVFHRGMFHVIGGYSTDMQGQFESSAEPFDASTWQWGPVNEDFFEVGTCPRTCVSGDDGCLYMCRAGELAAFKDATWKVVANLPNEVKEIAYVVTWQGKLLVIGSPRFGEPHMAYVLDTKQYTWTKMAVPEAYSTHVQSGCCLEL
ncbi:F-box/kelch-repeat protein [Morus notabilis]|uniref:F-box/kelch-repeat protein n=1 Tax=Morus notabilis TaxID=981085 RepID=W9S4X9_9ROSA|nr:F-box/kelch-repeat protein At1g15670 [Morus notabilis]EXC25817.1 F-box/kelch-repeat protein [Morus notabilis]